jgi:hypothetical protein
MFSLVSRMRPCTDIHSISAVTPQQATLSPRCYRHPVTVQGSTTDTDIYIALIGPLSCLSATPMAPQIKKARAATDMIQPSGAICSYFI